MAAVWLLSNSLYAEPLYIRITHGGGPDGYFSIEKAKNDAGDVAIECQGPGYSTCPTSVLGPHPGQGAVDHALYAIANNTLSGIWIDPITNYQVTWSAEETQGYNSEIYAEHLSSLQ